jgi:hypothetical protein
MRNTNYFGRKIGAVVTEKRRGTVSSVVVGDVRRFTANEQEMGSGILKFIPKIELSGPAAKRIAIGLSALKAAQWKHGCATWDCLGDYDTMLYSYRERAA